MLPSRATALGLAFAGLAVLGTPALAGGAMPSVRVNATSTLLYRAARTVGLEELVVRSEIAQLVDAARRSADHGDVEGARELMPDDLDGLTLAERRAISSLTRTLAPRLATRTP